MISHDIKTQRILHLYSINYTVWAIQWFQSEYHKPEKSCEAGSNPIASGYAMNAKPGPDFTTSVTSIQFLFRCLNTSRTATEKNFMTSESSQNFGIFRRTLINDKLLWNNPVCHVPQEWKDSKTSKNRRETVSNGDNQCISKYVIVELVVWGHCH